MKAENIAPKAVILALTAEQNVDFSTKNPQILFSTFFHIVPTFFQNCVDFYQFFVFVLFIFLLLKCLVIESSRLQSLLCH